MNLFDLSGKVAVVTGSSRGIGRAIAQRLAEHGAKVVISSRKAPACDEAAAAINARFPESARAIPANISSKADLSQLVELTLAAWGPIDILVCNAASNPHYGPLQDISDEQFRKVLENNILSSHWLIQLVAPHMRRRRSGSIILISSIAALRGEEMLGAYAVSKAADVQLARNLAVAFGPDSVRVNCIAPGLVKTDFARKLWEEDGERLAKETALRRIGEPDDIAGAAVFLAAPASSWLTGQTLVVDGGVMC
jgi:NAD(P)-dependent dehydrogenase (short-subunit alcohol dehydrogenase family)